MKRILALALCCLMCAALLPVALADGEGWYLVDSTSPDGYCYLYSAPSDRSAKSYNKGRHDNGELVYVLDYSGGQDGRYSYCHVRTMDGETGYMHDYALTRYTGISAEARADGEGWYTVSSTSPNGYCYLYSAPSDRDEKGCNLGRHDNGERVYVLDYYGGQPMLCNFLYSRACRISPGSSGDVLPAHCGMAPQVHLRGMLGTKYPAVCHKAPKTAWAWGSKKETARFSAHGSFFHSLIPP